MSLKRAGISQSFLASFFLTALFFPVAGFAPCSIATTQNVVFGGYDPLNASALLSEGAVTVECSGSLLGLIGSETFAISLDTGASGTYSPRAMTEVGGDGLSYNLYRDPARTEVWGDGTGGSFVVSDTIGGLLTIGTQSEDYPVYGRIPAMQDVTAGSYSDVITVTLDVQ
ncbi:MAG: Csu type fimbrial protein [Algiphilus sp.]